MIACIACHMKVLLLNKIDIELFSTRAYPEALLLSFRASEKWFHTIVETSTSISFSRRASNNCKCTLVTYSKSPYYLTTIGDAKDRVTRHSNCPQSQWRWSLYYSPFRRELLFPKADVAVMVRVGTRSSFCITARAVT